MGFVFGIWDFFHTHSLEISKWDGIAVQDLAKFVRFAQLNENIHVV